MGLLFASLKMYASSFFLVLADGGGCECRAASGHGSRRNLRSVRESLPLAGQEEKIPDEGPAKIPQSGLQRVVHIQGTTELFKMRLKGEKYLFSSFCVCLF